MANAKTQAYLANLKKTWPLDAKPVQPTTVQKVTTTPKPVVASPVATAPKSVTTQARTRDTPTQAQNTVKTVPSVTPTPVPAPSATTVPNTPKTTQPVTPAQPATPAPATTQKTTTPTKTTTKKPLDAWLNPEWLDYQAQDQARLNEIQANLTNYSQTSPEMFKTRDAYEANFKYGERSDEQKKVLDNFYKEYQLKQGNPDFVYQTLMSGGAIDPKYQNSAGFQQGYQKYQKIGMFGSMDAKQLATQLGKKLIVGSTEWQELAKINPMLAQEALQEKKKLDVERSLNGTYADMTGIEEWRIQEVDVVIEPLIKLNDRLWSLNINLVEEFQKDLIDNPVISDRRVKMEQRSRNIAEVQSVRDRAIDEAYASAWWAPDSVIRARANMQYRALNNQIALMQSDQEIDQAMLDTDIKRYESIYNAKIDEYNQEVAQFQEQAKYVMGIAETISGTLADQRVVKQEQEKTRIANEHDMAVKQAEQEYQMTRDDQAYARQVQLADRKYQQDLQSMQMKSNLDLQSSMTLAQQKAWLEWGGTVVWSQIVQQNPQSIVDYSTLKRWTEQLQCGQLVNDYVEQITGHTSGSPTWMWNLFSDKVNAINKIGSSSSPVVWWVFAMPTSTKYGHTGIVQSVDWDTFTVLEANASGNVNWEAPKLSTYKVNKNMKFSIEPKPKLSKDDSKVAWGAISQIKSKQIVKDYEKLYSKEWMLDNIITKLKNGTQTSQDDQQLISDFAKVLDPDSVVRESEYELSSKYSMSKLSRMKQDAYNYLKTGWPLTKDAATVLAAWLRSRYDVYKQNAISEVDAVLSGTEYTLWYKLPAWALWLWWYNQSSDTTVDQTNQNNTPAVLNPNQWSVWQAEINYLSSLWY